MEPNVCKYLHHTRYSNIMNVAGPIFKQNKFHELSAVSLFVVYIVKILIRTPSEM